MHQRVWVTGFAAALLTATLAIGQTTAYKSCAPLRTAPPPSDRPMEKGPAFFVDAAKGSDSAKGTQDAPWKTIGHALKQLSAGDTLYLRGGAYYENVYCAVAGTAEKPITIRSYPNEQAVLDGGLREFFESPAQAWEPAPDAPAGEYRSTRPYRNIRIALGYFGDSMVGLNTYYYEKDLRATNELWSGAEGLKGKDAATDVDPVYCGPGLWYDEATGYIYARLAHTHTPDVPNYTGETDPRKLPLIIAPFRSVPLMVDHARYVRFQDLVIRGGGHDVVMLDYAENVELDNVTIWCGAYGLNAIRTGPLKITRSGFYGSCPPWLFRSDTSKRAYPGRPYRDITRLNTHAPLVINSGREFDVFATPVNDNWEISYCEFTDSHDGPYFGGINLKFHHNMIYDTQDDGMYLSQMYPRHFYARSGAEIHIYQNYFGRMLTALAFGGTEDTRDKIFIYRNVFDLREPVFTGRPGGKTTTPTRAFGKVIGDHGSPPWPEITFYQNTFITAEKGNYVMALLGAATKEHPRRLVNNIIMNTETLMIPNYGKNPVEGAIGEVDGNLYWCPKADPAKGMADLKRLRKEGQDTNALVADPGFVRFDPSGKDNDYRLRKDSPAVGKGVELPADWPDPLRPKAGRPDIGALPADAPPFEFGRLAK